MSIFGQLIIEARCSKQRLREGDELRPIHLDCAFPCIPYGSYVLPPTESTYTITKLYSFNGYPRVVLNGILEVFAFNVDKYFRVDLKAPRAKKLQRILA